MGDSVESLAVVKIILALKLQDYLILSCCKSAHLYVYMLS